MIFNHLNWNLSYLISHFGNFFQILNQFKYRHLHFEHISYPGIIKLSLTVLALLVRIIFDPVKNMEEVSHVMYMNVVSPLIHFQIVRKGSKANFRTIWSHVITYSPRFRFWSSLKNCKVDQKRNLNSFKPHDWNGMHIPHVTYLLHILTWIWNYTPAYGPNGTGKTAMLPSNLRFCALVMIARTGADFRPFLSLVLFNLFLN